MTTAERNKTDSTQKPAERPRMSWGQVAENLANQMANPQFPRGDLAELRRMNPDIPSAPVFWRLMAQYDLLGSETVERKWALILNGMAIMTRTHGGNVVQRSAHRRNMPVGRALYLGGESSRGRAFYSEARLSRLLVAYGPTLRALLVRTFRMMASAERPFDWREMALLILNDGYNEDAAEGIRRQIARQYYIAESVNAQNAATE